MVFIRYPAYAKGYVMYEEHPNGGIIEIESLNVDLLEDEFPSIGEIKKDQSCMSYSKTFNHLSVRGRI